MAKVITRTAVGLVILVLTLVLSAASASAECAWVLWIRAVPTDANGRVIGAWTPWAPHGVSSTPSGCEGLEPRNDPEKIKRAVHAAGLPQDQPGTLQWQCLPDTVDPRGPKGTK